MLFRDMGLSVPCAPISSMPNTFRLPKIGYAVECLLFEPNKPQLNVRISLRKNMSFSLSSVRAFLERHSYRILSTSSNLWDACHVTETFEQKFNGNSPEEQISTEEIQLDCHSNSVDNFGCEDNKESTRRRKIGVANKGRVPWNKGRKHSAETRERIRERTKEALRDPKVRKKMSECPRAHSNQTKARIRTSLRRLWAERLKWKRSGETFLLSWASDIAKAAKIGGSDQQELEWDSYGKMKSEIAFQQRQWATDKAKAKEMVWIRGQRAAQAKAEKLTRLAEKRKELVEKTKVKGELKKKMHKKSKEEIKELAVAQELKLKERLAKIHKKKSTNGQVSNQDHRAWERFDLELIKRDQMQKEVSLADQIQAVKNKRALTITPAVYPSSERSIE